jgi:hypothetical protein
VYSRLSEEEILTLPEISDVVITTPWEITTTQTIHTAGTTYIDYELELPFEWPNEGDPVCAAYGWEDLGGLAQKINSIYSSAVIVDEHLNFTT